jgi:hypothetical protein
VILFPHIPAMLSLLFCLCIPVDKGSQVPEGVIIHPSANTLSGRFSPPPGYERVEADSGSFAFYLRHLPLMPHGSPVMLYNGTLKPWQGGAAAVIDISVGNKDLQQCADAVIRLRAEYLRKTDHENEIVFNFTNGSPASWESWKEGYRCLINGNNVRWEHSAAFSESDLTFWNYLETVFMYAGTWSLEKELVPVEITALMPGDVFIEGGSPGHAVIVVDVAKNAAGQKVFLLAQSFMPAQDIHVLTNPADPDLSPWYRLPGEGQLHTPEWKFSAGSLRRFS